MCSLVATPLLPGPPQGPIFGGSAQGISILPGGYWAYRQIYKDVKVKPGRKYEARVDVWSDLTQLTEPREGWPIVFGVEYRRSLKSARSIYGYWIRGDVASIRPGAWVGIIMPGRKISEQYNQYEPFMIAPKGARWARIILRVQGGGTGEALFDDVEFNQID